MQLGYATQVVDGQRNSFPTSWAYHPTQYGPQTTGVPQVSPTMPPFLGANASTGGMSGSPGADGVGGYGTAGNNQLVTQIAAQNPHNLKVSPVWWTVGALVGGLILLKVVHWRSLEEGTLALGPARATERVGD